MKHKIIHIAPTPFFADRGCHIRIEGIVRCLDQLEYDNLVCTYHHGRDVETVSTRRIKPIANYTQTAAGPSKYKLLADWRLLWLTFREYRRQKPAVIHAHLHEGLLIGVLVKMLMFWRRTPLLADMQGSLTGELDAYGKFNNRPMLKRLTHLFEYILLRFPNHIVCSSTHSLLKLRNEFGVAKSKSSLAQDGADEFAGLEANDIANIRNDLDLPKDKIIAVYSGALLDSKGLEQLKQLIKLSANKNIHFLIIGYPTEGLKSFLLDQDLVPLCTLTGQVAFERLPSLLFCSDVAIDPKNSEAGEGSGKMLNYLACGLPVVAFNTANNREFAPKGSELADDIEQLAKILHALADDSEKREAAGQAAKQHFRERYAWRLTQDQLQRAYNKILKSRPPETN